MTSEKQRSSVGPPLVLLVEDLNNDLMRFRHLAKNADFEVSHVHDSEEARQFIQSHHESNSLSAAIIDLGLPNVNEGLALIDLCRDLIPKVPILVWTIQGKAYQETAMQRGAYCCVSKADSDSHLLEKLGEILTCQIR